MKKIISIIACAMAVAACGSNTKTADISGKWNIDSACGISTEGAETPAFIDFEEGGKMNGNASVNTFFGDYSYENEKLTLSNVGMTRMMGASMEIEDKIVEALDNVATLKVDGEKANVYNSKGEVVMTLSR